MTADSSLGHILYVHPSSIPGGINNLGNDDGLVGIPTTFWGSETMARSYGKPNIDSERICFLYSWVNLLARKSVLIYAKVVLSQVYLDFFHGKKFEFH